MKTTQYPRTDVESAGGVAQPDERSNDMNDRAQHEDTNCQHDRVAAAWDAFDEMQWIRREALALSNLPVPAEGSPERAAWQARWDRFVARKLAFVESTR